MAFSRAFTDEGTSPTVLGSHCFDVYRECHASGAEFAAHWLLGPPSKGPLSLFGCFIVIVCIIGAYSLQNTSFDVGVMMAFGVLGYLLRKGGFPGAPLVLAMLLGPILERSLQQSLKLSAGDLGIFINKPISLTLLLITAVMMLIPAAKGAWIWSRSVQRNQMIS